jgi:hypothetical protein
MKERCTNPNHKNYNLYKGKLCQEWYDSKAFIAWAYQNGYEDGLTIDRIDSSKGYSPSNCQWLTQSDNAKKSNRDRYKKYQYEGNYYSLRGLEILLGLPKNILHQRMNKQGLTFEEALTLPYRYTRLKL